MHLFLLTRGIKHCIDRYINDCQAQYYNMPNWKGGNIVQMGVRPIQLWEFVFPKEALQEVLPTVIKCPRPESEMSFAQKNVMKMFRKLLTAKPIPEYDINGKRRIVYNEHIEVTPIGIKEDATHKEGHEML